MERTNALADSVGAAVALDWWGFHAINRFKLRAYPRPSAGTQQPPSADEMAQLEPGLRNLLRRFVSDRWIDASAGGRVDRSNQRRNRSVFVRSLAGPYNDAAGSSGS